ncbi:hypothetical protein C0J52_16658 [Blattella germanica]|nr:hypothetical protein C0J52_16658 [Blattella germanica]
MWTFTSALLSKNIKLKIYKTVILPVILYGCETWTLTLREEKRLRVFENKRRGEWRRLHNTELKDLYGKLDIIRKITGKSHRLRWAGHWENNINHDLKEVDYTGDDWKTLAQDRDVWRAYVRTAMNLRVR